MDASDRRHREDLELRAQSEILDEAVMAVMDLAVLDEADGRLDQAASAYREVIASGHEGQSARATFELARVLELCGDPATARLAYRHLLTSGISDYAGQAVCALRRLDRAAGDT